MLKTTLISYFITALALLVLAAAILTFLGNTVPKAMLVSFAAGVALERLVPVVKRKLEKRVK